MRDAVKDGEKMVGSFLRNVKAEASKAEATKRAAEGRIVKLKDEIIDLEKEKNALVTSIANNKSKAEAKVEAMLAEAKTSLDNAKTIEGDKQDALNTANAMLKENQKKEKSLSAELSKVEALKAELLEEKGRISKIADLIKAL